MRKTLLFIVTYLMLSIIVLPSLAANEPDQDIKVYVNDTLVQFDVAPIFINNRTMVPIRAVFEAMGADVQWNDSIKTAIIIKGEKRVQIQYEQPQRYGRRSVLQMDVPATGINVVFSVPLRFTVKTLA